MIRKISVVKIFRCKIFVFNNVCTHESLLLFDYLLPVCVYKTFMHLIFVFIGECKNFNTENFLIYAKIVDCPNCEK